MPRKDSCKGRNASFGKSYCSIVIANPAKTKRRIFKDKGRSRGTLDIPSAPVATFDKLPCDLQAEDVRKVKEALTAQEKANDLKKQKAERRKQGKKAYKEKIRQEHRCEPCRPFSWKTRGKGLSSDP